MPNSVLRVALAVTALLAVVLFSGTGLAAADPDPAGGPTDSGSTTEPSGGEPQTPPASTAPQPTTPTTRTAQLPDLPGAVAGALRDFFNRPLSIFGNGRVPGQAPTPVAVNPNGVAAKESNNDPGRHRPTAKPVAEPDPAPAEPVVAAARSYGSVVVALPFLPPVSHELPQLPVPGFDGLRLTIDLTDPTEAVTTLQETANTVNSLLADAYAPYDPFRPPVPRPAFRTQGEEPEPVVDAGPGAVTSVAQSSSDLPVLQAPPIVPPLRVVLPLPIMGTSGAGTGATPQVRGAGSVDVRAQAPRGPGAQTGSPGEPPPNASASGLGRPVARQAYGPELRAARGPHVAAVAVPGLLGLLALVATGVVTGYRQANAQRHLRSDAARVLR